MKISFTKKEVIRFIKYVYLPLLIIPTIIGYYRGNRIFELTLMNILLYFTFPFWFSYPVHLLVNLRIKKFLHWFFIGVVPFTIISYISSMKDEIVKSFFLSIMSANIMYPILNGIIQTLKEYWEMSREMTLGRKIGLFLSLIFILISILKRARL